MKLIAKYLTIFAILASSLSLYAQNKIEISTELVKIGGEVFYAHTVKRGETLYSLSKAYNTTIEEITKQNPGITSGLKAGNIIYIVKGQAEKAQAEKVQTEKVQTEAVQSAVEDNKSAQDERVIPAKEGKKKLKGKRHIVKWYEDIDDIAKKYNMPAEDILAYNGLTSRKMSKRQVLFIPLEGIGSAKKEQSDLPVKEVEQAEDTLSNRTDSLALDKVEYNEQPVERDWFSDRINVAMLLPLKSRSKAERSTNYMDFYAGALLAMNKLKESGDEVTLNVIDSKEYNSVNEILQSPGFENNNLIIGPIVYTDLQTGVEYSNNSGKPIISPMDPAGERLIEGNSNFIQAPTHSKYQMENLISGIKREIREGERASNVLLIYQKSTYQDTALLKEARELCIQNEISYKELSYTILEGRDILSAIISNMDTTKNNIALVPSNDEAFVSDVVRNLNLCTNSNYKVTLFGMSKWRNFESIDIDLFHKMRLHLALPFYIDYSREDVKEFIYKYRALFNTEPTPYSFQGYDLTYYFVNRALKYGETFTRGKQIGKASLLQTNLDLVREEAGNGFENRATRNIVYNPDFTITLIEE